MTAGPDAEPDTSPVSGQPADEVTPDAVTSADPVTAPITVVGSDRPALAKAARRRARFAKLSAGVRSAVSFWGRSLRLRVLVLTLLFSSLVMIALGLVLQQQITDRLLAAKISAAETEVRNAGAIVASQMKGTDPDRQVVQVNLQRALQSIGTPLGDSNSAGQGGSAGVFQPVIVALHTVGVAAGPVEQVPADLQLHVADGNLAEQYTSVSRGGTAVPALVVGMPVGTSVATSTESFGVYLIFPLTSEQSTVGVVQTTLLLGGGALTLALTLIATLVASQVVRPVRRAAAVAQRFAAGALDERMPVKGAIELTTMARSFNGMAEAIRAQIRQLEQFGRLQRRFTSDVSHELRTPVTTVRMAADLLHSERAAFPPHLARASELLVAELDRFETLLGDLLEISRYDAGMAELNAEAIDIRAHVAGCVDGFHSLAAKARVTIDLRMPDAPVVAEVDSRRFERIVRNLLGNAIDHAEGGTVDVEIGSDDSAVAVSVTDHGVGLKPGESSLVFNRFWRADPSRQRQTGGTGLGLAIALEDARLHGGWLQASGAPGVGARFRLTLPQLSGALVTGSPLPLRVSRGSDEPADWSDDDGRSVGDQRIVDPRVATIAGLPQPAAGQRGSQR